MPCNSEYMEQTPLEAYYQRTAKLLLFILTSYKNTHKLSQNIKMIEKEANTYYCKTDYTKELCGLLKDLEKNRDEFSRLFDIKNKNARDLMDWWQEHQEADKAREKAEAEKVVTEVLRKKALAKLTPAERAALGY